MYTSIPHIPIAIGILVAAVIIVLYEIWLMMLRPPIDIHAVAFQQLLDLFSQMVADENPTEYCLTDVIWHAQAALYALRRSRAKININRKIEFYQGLMVLLIRIEHRHGSGRANARKCLRMVNTMRKLTTPSLVQRTRSALRS